MNYPIENRQKTLTDTTEGEMEETEYKIDIKNLQPHY